MSILNMLCHRSAVERAKISQLRKSIWRVAVLVCGLSSGVVSHAQTQSNTMLMQKNDFVTLTFHDVRDDVAKVGDRDIYAISTTHLSQFFAWLKQSDWNVITLQDLMLAREHKKDLPPKALLLTFDDGALSSYQRVFPLLKTYQLHAVFAIPTSWINGNTKDGYEAYGVGNLMNWTQMREMQRSGWVEFGSHSDDMHSGLIANPQLNTQPKAVARAYDPVQKHYESDVSYQHRVYQDLKRSKTVLDRELGINATAIFWPYGAVTEESSALAARAGFPLSFSLGQTMTSAKDDVIHQRALIMENPTPELINELMHEFIKFDIAPYKQAKRILNVDLNTLVSPTLAEADEKLGLLLNRVQALKSNTMIFKAVVADPEGTTGHVAFFPNRHIPMRQDLLNRTVWQSRTRIFNRTYAELPLSLGVLPRQRQDFADIVEDLMKNNTSVEGIILDSGDYLDCAVANTKLDVACQERVKNLFEITALMEDKSSYYSNISNNHQSAIKINLHQTQLDGLAPLMAQINQLVGFVYLNIDPVQQADVFKALLQQLAQLDQERKQHIMISFNIQAQASPQALQAYQKDYQAIKALGIQKLVINNYNFELAQQIHQHLYSEMSLNDSPLTYRDPFQAAQQAGAKGGQR